MRIIDADALFDSLIFPNDQWEKTFKELLDDEPTVDPSKCFDGMTNGEVVQALFPNIELGEKVYNTRRYFFMGESIETFDFKTTDRWWNAPYKAESEDKDKE